MVYFINACIYQQSIEQGPFDTAASPQLHVVLVLDATVKKLTTDNYTVTTQSEDETVLSQEQQGSTHNPTNPSAAVSETNAAITQTENPITLSSVDNFKQPQGQKSHYTDPQDHHSLNPPAAPLSDEPVQYATVKEQTDNTVTTQPKVSHCVLLDGVEL